MLAAREQAVDGSGKWGYGRGPPARVDKKKDRGRFESRGTDEKRTQHPFASARWALVSTHPDQNGSNAPVRWSWTKSIRLTHFESCIIRSKNIVRKALTRGKCVYHATDPRVGLLAQHKLYAFLPCCLPVSQLLCPELYAFILKLDF